MYKTIVWELIQEEPERYEEFRSTKRLLPAIEAYAVDLRTRHLQWQEQLRREKPNRDPRQITAEAMELAIQDLRVHLPSASSPAAGRRLGNPAAPGHAR